MSSLDKEDIKQIERIIKKHSDRVRDNVLKELGSQDVKNARIAEFQWLMALGIGVMLASPAFIDKQNATNDWWQPVLIFLCGYIMFIYPGLRSFYRKYIRKCCQSAKWDTFKTEHFGIIRRH